MTIAQTSRTKSFIDGTFFAYLYQAAVMVVGLWLTPFTLGVLGQQKYGVWLVGLQILTFMLLMDLGVVAILPRDVARCAGLLKSNPASTELADLVHKTGLVVLWQSALLALVSMLIWFFWPGITPEIRGPLAVALGAFCLSFPLRMYAAILEGLQDLRMVAQVRIASWIASTVIMVVLLLAGWGLYALAAGWAVNVIAIQGAALLRLYAIRPDLVGFRFLGQSSLRWKDFTRGSWLSVGQVAQALLGGFELIAIAKLMGPAAVVPYNCTNKLVSVLANQPKLLVFNALPGLSEMKTSESSERVIEVATMLTQAMLTLSGAVVCVVFAVNEPFTKIWVGPQFFGGMTLTTLLLVNLLLRYFDLTLAQALFAFGYERPMAIKALIDGIVSTGAGFLLVYWYGINGAVMGKLLGAVLITLPVNIALFSREFNLSTIRVLLPYVPFLWRILAVCAAGHLLARTVQPHTYLGVGIICVVVLAIYAALIVPYVLQTPLRAYIVALQERMRRQLGFAH